MLLGGIYQFKKIRSIISQMSIRQEGGMAKSSGPTAEASPANLHQGSSEMQAAANGFCQMRFCFFLTEKPNEEAGVLCTRELIKLPPPDFEKELS